MNNEAKKSVCFDQSAVLSERQPAPRRDKYEAMKESNMLGENLETEYDIKNSVLGKSR